MLAALSVQSHIRFFTSLRCVLLRGWMDQNVFIVQRYQSEEGYKIFPRIWLPWCRESNQNYLEIYQETGNLLKRKSGNWSCQLLWQQSLVFSICLGRGVGLQNTTIFFHSKHPGQDKSPKPCKKMCYALISPNVNPMIYACCHFLHHKNIKIVVYEL